MAERRQLACRAKAVSDQHRKAAEAVLDRTAYQQLGDLGLELEREYVDWAVGLSEVGACGLGPRMHIAEHSLMGLDFLLDQLDLDMREFLSERMLERYRQYGPLTLLDLRNKDREAAEELADAPFYLWASRLQKAREAAE